MTSNGQLVKLSQTSADLHVASEKSSGFYHHAAVLWNRWTAVQDHFTGVDWQPFGRITVHISTVTGPGWLSPNVICALWRFTVVQLE